MNDNHKEQIAFLKKKIKLGYLGNDLFALFNREYKLEERTYERRVSVARAQMSGSGKQPINWVLLNIVGADNTPTGIPTQEPTAESRQNEAESTDRINTRATFIGGRQLRGRKDRQPRTERATQKAVQKSRQKAAPHKSVLSAAAEVTAAAENLLCMEVLSVEECLLMLSRFAMGQYVRARHISCGGEVVEVMETPPFTARKSAVMAILKYHEAVAKEKGGMVDNEPRLEVDLDEFARMTPDELHELNMKFLNLGK